MYCPIVGERVWVSGCRDEFIVAQTDYIACLAMLAAEKDGTKRAGVPFGLLFEHCEFEVTPAGAITPAQVRNVLRSSDRNLRAAAVLIWSLRETIRESFNMVRQSKSLIFESDRIIARLQTLDCDHATEGFEDISTG